VVRLLPSGSVEVVNAATPFVSVALPRGVEPLANETVPDRFADKVYVKVTGPPGKEGFTEDVRVDVGLSLATVCTVVPTAEL
jgi:hypothetical protein